MASAEIQTSAAQAPARRRRLRRLAWWLGAFPAVLSLSCGWLLRWLPTLHDVPQRDRPYGWLEDLIAGFAASASYILAAIFALFGIALLILSLRAPADH